MKKRIEKLLIFICLSIITAVFVFPFLWTFLTSIKPDTEIYSSTIKFFPQHAVISHYIKLITQMGSFTSYFMNSVYITFWSLLFVIVLSATSGYTFGMLNFKGRGIIFGFILIVLTLPYAIYLIPIYIMQDKWNIINTIWCLILPYTALNLPMGMLIMRGNFKNIPKDLEDAATIDGCNYFNAWYRVLIPIVKPGLAVVAILTFISVWGEFMYARTLTNTSAAQTLSVGITFLKDEAASWQYGTLTAAIVLTLIPPLIIFLAMQRYFVKGIIEGALKG